MRKERRDMDENSIGKDFVMKDGITRLVNGLTETNCLGDLGDLGESKSRFGPATLRELEQAALVSPSVR